MDIRACESPDPIHPHIGTRGRPRFAAGEPLLGQVDGRGDLGQHRGRSEPVTGHQHAEPQSSGVGGKGRERRSAMSGGHRFHARLRRARSGSACDHGHHDSSYWEATTCRGSEDTVHHFRRGRRPCPGAGSSTIPLPRRTIRTRRRPSSSSISRTRSRFGTGRAWRIGRLRG